MTGNVLGVQKGFDFKSFATSVATAGITDGLLGPATNPSGVIGNAIKNAVGTSYAAIAARAVVGNVINQGVGNITGSQKGFSWSSVAIAGVGSAAAAFATNQMGLTKFDGQGQIQPSDTGFGTDFSRALVDAGSFALSQLVVKGGKINWMQVATDTVTNLIQNRAESQQIDQNAKLVKKQRLAQGNTSESDSDKRLFKANQAYAEANQLIAGMTSKASSQGGMALAAAAENATDEVIAAAYKKQQADQTATMPLLFTTLAKEGGAAGGTLAQQAGLTAARIGGLFVDVTGAPPRDVATKAASVNALNKANKSSDDALVVQYAMNKLNQIGNDGLRVGPTVERENLINRVMPKSDSTIKSSYNLTKENPFVMFPVRVAGDVASLFRDDGINFATGEVARLNEPYAGLRLFTDAATTFSPLLEEGAALTKFGANLLAGSAKWLMPAAENMSYKFMSNNGFLLNIVPEETWVTGHLRAEVKGFPGVGRTVNGGPTFAGTDYLYPVSEGQKNIVNIKLTGDYAKDFAAANVEAGFVVKPKYYSWHHVDDFNTETGRATLELVQTKAHRATTPHRGSAAQFRKLNGYGY